MSHRLKLTVFVLTFNVIGFAEGYLLRDLGLVWLLPILIVTALGAVLSIDPRRPPRRAASCEPLSEELSGLFIPRKRAARARPSPWNTDLYVTR